MATLAELLRELKERSGLSYGVLAKRLHMSTSTLHRYCNGDAVPTEFAPVERFARLCKASPEELVEVHRRWILADASRGKKATEPERAEPGPETPAPEPELVADRPRSSPASRRRRPLILAAAVAAVVGISSVALAMNGDSDDGKKRDTGAAASPRPGDSPDDAPTRRSEDKGDDGKKKDDDKKKHGASASPSKGSHPDPEASRGPGKGPASAGGNSGNAFDVPVTVRTRPYAMDDPCLQDFLVNRKASEVPEQPAVQDAAGWVGDLGAVPAGRQLIEVTVQGTGDETVVLQDMNVRVQSTSAPLAWNNFQMATGCGGDVDPKSFSIDLDDASPQVKPGSGQRDFPYKVSEKDPEVFFIIANTDLHDVRWYLELEWSSGKRHDSLRIDDQSKPFRTSGKKGRPTYGWPPGYDKWIKQPNG